MLRVKVSLFATLRRYHPEADGKKNISLDVPDDTTLTQLYTILGIPAAEIKMTFVNNRHETGTYILQDGDKVALFPPIAGG